jgi:hypothetical protein
MKPEHIPDEAFLFRRIHLVNWKPEAPMPDAAAFDDVKMSCDWQKYARIEETISRAKKPSGSQYGAVMLQVGFLRAPDGGKPNRSQEVNHAPKILDDEEGPRNYSHSEVVGEKSLRLGRRLAKHAMTLERHIRPVKDKA